MPLLLFALLACWFAVLWIYFDLKQFRRRGVTVTPGLTALKYLLIPWVIEFGSLFGFISPYRVFGNLAYSSSWYIVFQFIPLVFPIASLILYYYLRSTRYARRAALGNAPLPPAPAWTKWLFFFFFLLPLLLTAALVIFLVFFWKFSF